MIPTTTATARTTNQVLKEELSGTEGRGGVEALYTSTGVAASAASGVGLDAWTGAGFSMGEVLVGVVVSISLLWEAGEVSTSGVVSMSCLGDEAVLGVFPIVSLGELTGGGNS